MKTKQASFKATTTQIELTKKIAHRAVALAAAYGIEYQLLEAHMDLTACCANGCPLDLPKLLAADDGNFGHDVFGIRRHINRTTGELQNCFVPRCASAQPVAA